MFPLFNSFLLVYFTLAGQFRRKKLWETESQSRMQLSITGPVMCKMYTGKLNENMEVTIIWRPLKQNSGAVKGTSISKDGTILGNSNCIGRTLACLQ
jgi:hypothetical protein